MAEHAHACTWDKADFSAVAEYFDEVRWVRVSGSVVCPTPHYSIALERDNEGIVNQPDVLVLKVSATAPIGPVIEVLRRTPFTAYFEDMATRVEIRGLDLTLDVVEPE